MAQDLGPDMWAILGHGTPRIWVEKDAELPVDCNQHGAIFVVTPYGNLGVKPLECDIIEWREPNDAERPNVKVHTPLPAGASDETEVKP
jgi:hypothetical protein